MIDFLDFMVVCGHLISNPPPVLEVGDILRLEAEPTNTYDPYAVKVYKEEKQIGWIPNKGKVCIGCWSPIRPKESGCNCGETAWTNGGLARRIIELKMLEKKYYCYVHEVRPPSTPASFDQYIVRLIPE